MRTSALCFLALATSLALTGCGADPLTLTDSSVTVQGILHGGQQPMVGTHVYLMAAAVSGTVAANNGYGNASVSMLTGTGLSDSIGGYVLTNALGSFTIPAADYSCAGAGTTSNSQVYIYALGGSSIGGQTNSAAGFLAALGTCGSLSSFGSIYVDEVTTIATAYALAGFAVDATHISIPAYTTGPTPDTLAATGLKNAFMTAPNLANFTTGQALSAAPTSASSVAPQTAVNTLADILAACVNTATATSATISTTCQTLLENATSTGVATTSPTATGTPTDTATAAINIAHHPYANVSTLFNLQVPQSPFLPSFASNAQPTDFTLCINFNVTDGRSGVAVDAAGNIWQNQGGNIFVYSNNGTRISPASGGYPLPPAANGNGGGIAFDLSGNLWVVTYGAGTFELTSSGGQVNTTAYDSTNPLYPFGIAADTTGHVWTSTLHEMNSSGTVIYPGTIAPNGAFSDAIAMDSNGIIWSEAGRSTGGTTLLLGTTPAGALLPNEASTGIVTGGCSPGSIAIDSANTVWMVNQFFDNGTPTPYICKLVYSAGTYTATAYSMPESMWSIAVDGAGNIFGGMLDWSSTRQPSVIELNNAGTVISPPKGYAYNILANYIAGEAYQGGVAVDGSGNVWWGGTDELVGLGTPVVTPLVQSLIAPYTPGSRP